MAKRAKSEAEKIAAEIASSIKREKTLEQVAAIQVISLEKRFQGNDGKMKAELFKKKFLETIKHNDANLAEKIEKEVQAMRLKIAERAKKKAEKANPQQGVQPPPLKAAAKG